MVSRIHRPHVATLLLGMMCILMQYKYVVNLGYIVGFILLLFYILNKKRCCIPIDFLCVILVIILQTWLCVGLEILHYNLAVNDTVNFVLLTMVIVFSLNYEKKVQTIELYKKVCIVCACVVVGQTIFSWLFGIQSGALRILPQSMQTDAYWQISSHRPSAFFTEAQTYCSFLLPALILMIHGKEYRMSILITFSFLLTGSSMGIMVALVPWIGLLLNSSLKVYQKISLTIIAFLFGIIFLTSTLFEVSVEKFATIFSDFKNYSTLNMIQSSSYSNYMRIIKGWTTLSELSWPNRITGLGFYNFLNYAQKRDLYFSWSRIWSNAAAYAAYYSSASGVFIDFGLVAGTIYYVYLVRLLRNGNYPQKVIIFSMLLQSFFTQIHFNSLCVFYLMTYYLLQGHKSFQATTTKLVMQR